MKKAFFALAISTILAGHASAADQYWKLNGSASGSAGGATPSGTWDTATANWTTNSAGTAGTNVWAANDAAFFSAASDATGAFNITVSGTQTLSGLTVEEGSVSTTGAGTLDFGATSRTINVASGASFTNLAGNVLAGTEGLVKAGSGTLFLRGTNTFSNAGTGTQAYLTINSGVVDFRGDTALGAAPTVNNIGGVLTINGGTLRYDNTAALTLNVNRNIDIGANGATIDVVVSSNTGLSLAGSANAALALRGSSTITKTGAGRFTLNTTQTGYTGKWIVNQGTISSAGDGRFGPVPASVVADYFTLNGGALRNSLTTATVWNANRGITLGANGGSLMQPGGGTGTDSLTYNGVIAGTSNGGLTITNSDAAGGGTTDGIVILGGANTYDGATTVTAGMTLRLGANDVLPNTALTLSASSVTFDLNGNSDTIGSLAGAGGVTLGAGTLTLGGGNLTGASHSGVISGTGGIGKTGTGTQTLSGANTFDGAVAVNQGILVATSAAALGSTVGSTTVSSGAQLQVSGTAAVAENLTLNGSGVSGTGALLHTGSNKTLSGTIALGSNSRIQSSAASTVTLSLTGAISGANVDLDLAGTGAMTVQTGGINLGTGKLTIDGTGTSVFRLKTANTVGSVNLKGGLTNYDINGALGSGTVTVDIAAGAGGIGASSSLGSLTINNTMVLNAGSAMSLSPASGSTVTLAGDISGNGMLVRDDFNNTGAGTVVLSGNNSFSGGVQMNTRGLVLGSKTALGTGTLTIGDTVTAPAQALTLTANTDLSGANAVGNAVTVNQNFSVLGTNKLELSGNMNLGAANRTATVSNTADTTISGVISSGAAGGLTKAGAGVLILSGANTYGTSGSTGTTVSAGKLLVNNTTGSGTGAGNVLVNGGTLGGTGTIAGDVSVTSGKLAPGASIAALNIGGSLSMSGGSFDYEINSSTVTADLNNVGGGLSLSGGVGLLTSDLGGALLAMGTKFTLINYGGVWNGGTFAGLPNYSTTLVIGANRFAIRYDDTTGGINFGGGSVGLGSKFVTITAVPEASTFVAFGIGLAFTVGLVWVGRRMGVNVLKA